MNYDISNHNKYLSELKKKFNDTNALFKNLKKERDNDFELKKNIIINKNIFLKTKNNELNTNIETLNINNQENILKIEEKKKLNQKLLNQVQIQKKSHKNYNIEIEAINEELNKELLEFSKFEKEKNDEINNLLIKKNLEIKKISEENKLKYKIIDEKIDKLLLNYNIYNNKLLGVEILIKNLEKNIKNYKQENINNQFNKINSILSNHILIKNLKNDKINIEIKEKQIMKEIDNLKVIYNKEFLKLLQKKTKILTEDNIDKLYDINNEIDELKKNHEINILRLNLSLKNLQNKKKVYEIDFSLKIQDPKNYLSDNVFKEKNELKKKQIKLIKQKKDLTDEVLNLKKIKLNYNTCNLIKNIENKYIKKKENILNLLNTRENIYKEKCNNFEKKLMKVKEININKITETEIKYNNINSSIQENNENIKYLELTNKKNILKIEQFNILIIKGNNEIGSNKKILKKITSDIQKKNNIIDLEEYDILNELQNKILELTYKISKINKI